MGKTLENYLSERIARQVIDEERRRQILNENAAVIIKWLPQIITILTKLWPVLERLAQNQKFEKYRGMIAKLGRILNVFKGVDFGMNKAYANTDGNHNGAEHAPYGNTY